MQTLQSKTLWGYGAGNLGYGLVSQITAAYLVFYATAILGMSGASIGMLMSIGIIWDALSDPIMGYLSDHTRTKRFGRRHLYLLIGGIGVTLVNLLLWNIDRDLTHTTKWLLMVFYVLGLRSFMTVYITPYTALAAEISEEYTDRTRIQAVKTAFFLIGIFLATAFGMAIFFQSTDQFPIGQLNPDGYRNMSIFASAFMVLAMAITYITTSPLIPDLNARLLSHKAPSFKTFFVEMGEAFSNKDFRAVVLGYLFTNIASALLSTLALHVYTYTFHMTNNGIAIIVGLQLVASIASQPFWIMYSDKHEKRQAVLFGLQICFAACIYFLLSVAFRTTIRDGFYLLIPFGILAGFGTGGLFTIPQAMVADAVDANALTVGKRQEGVFYGTLTLCYKLSQSIAIFMLGFALDWLKFNADSPVQPEPTVIGLALIMAAGSLVSFLLAYGSYLPYTLTKVKMADIHKAILEKRHASQS